VKTRFVRWLMLFLFFVWSAPQAFVRAAEEPLLTVAEKSDFKSTSRHADVMDFCRALAQSSTVVRLGELGTSFERRPLPLLILADPPVATAAEAAKSKKLVVFAIGNIHAGEVDGKEALLMLARDIATAKERPLLKDLILVIAPIFNADGNERIDKSNRTTQNGPAEGVGTRANSQGFDLNRDFVKLESPEVRAFVRFLNQWDPAVVIDCHTTNGSYHRYTITYEGGRVPNGDSNVIAYVRECMLPDLSRRLEKLAGYKSFFYGNFNPDRTRWETVLPTPRFGTHYVGLRNRIAILSESYTYAPYKERVLASRAFVRSICEFTAENKEKIENLLAASNSSPKTDAQPDGAIILRYKAAALGQPVSILGFVEETKNGRRVSTAQTRDYPVQYFGDTESTLSVRRPYAYLFPAKLDQVVENLQRHGIEVEELREDIELDLEIYRLDRITRLAAFQKHQPVSLEATLRKESRRVEAGSKLVRTGQRLGRLAAFLLEPQSLDGPSVWNFFDDYLKERQDFPVLRLPDRVPITSCRVRPLAEDRVRDKPITYDLVHGKRAPNFSGSPVSGLTWLDDGEQFLQRKGNKLYKVQAATGRLQPFFDPAKLAQGLETLPTIGREAAQRLTRAPLNMNPQRTGAFFTYESDLYFCNLDGAKPVRLTKTPGTKELVTFSPDGQFVAFVRQNNLYVVDIATQSERALTTDGGNLISNGKADWVYFEEIFDRNWRAYWWSPDSKQIAFLRFDDTPVHKFTVLDHIPIRQNVETTAYPKAGDPNPLVKLGIVAVAGAPVRWVDLSNYSETASLLIRVAWTPDSQKVFFYVQDRAQTWLDVCTVSPSGEDTRQLFRETTRAWVDDPGNPTFLKDGSFLLPSERNGWKHLYHFDAEGKLKQAITSGPWEVRSLHQVDEANGWVYFSGTRDCSIADNLYRVKLDGTMLERLSKTSGEHRVNLSPKCNFYVDSRSSQKEPTDVRLFRSDGTFGRIIDTNPVYALEEYRFGALQLVQIKTPDGFVLEGSLLKPADFDPAKKYPAWFMTYAGPHAPTIHDSWSRNRAQDEVLAHLGVIVFRCDPRSASGKGACSTWTAYRQLGVQELKDIETAIGWLTQQPFIDARRIGMSGASYGGFMTAYAMTHSKLFAAGIASAPVTDWRNYDSIYTERYMNTPQENPHGYNNASVVKAAGNLHGRLLLIHGLMDDNVHVQNSVQFIQELQRANKDFETMFYPRSRHGGFGPHYQRLVIDFIQRSLGIGPNETKTKS